MVDLAVEARTMWDQWSEEFGTELLSKDGSIALGEAAARRVEVLEARPDTPVRRVGPDELRSLLPVLADYHGPAMFDEKAGAIRTRAAIAALSANVADAFINDHVLAVRPISGGVEVRAGASVSTHAAAVVCAGRGTAALAASVGVVVPVRVTAHAQASFRVRGGPVAALPNLQDGSGAFGRTGIYATAYPDRSAFGLGYAGEVAVDDAGGVEDPDGLADLVDQAAAYVSTALPGLDPEPFEYVHCWVTTLPWGDDGVAIWQADNIYVLAGHNLFKHAPVLGDTLARSVGDASVPELFRPESRLGGG
jgi:sarcosine oxidase